MPSDRTVVEHLLDGRKALVLEVERLTLAIGELDAVIGRIGGSVPFGGSGPGDGSPTQPVNTAGSGATAGARASARRATRSTGRSRQAGTSGKQITNDGAGGQKSIRVHVLEMLAAENRDFGLAEIIDRIHDEGIQAHDDAVRSITIKLMKDGQVERVGRGMYRLADPASTSSSATPADSPDAPTDNPEAPADSPDAPADSPEAPDTEPANATGLSAPVQRSAADAADAADAAADDYVPPLNLNQPWERH